VIHVRSDGHGPKIYRLHDRSHQRDDGDLSALTRPQKITFAGMRAAGVSGVLVYCSDFRCSHWTRLEAGRWADDVRLSDLEPRFICAACRRGGADVRPDWQTAESQFPTLVTM
jgi:hypothetical protein